MELDNFKFQPVCQTNLPERLLSRARTELNETEEIVEQGLKTLKEKIKKENLYLEKDDILLKFLRVKKYRNKASFEGYKQYLRSLGMCLEQLKIPDFETFKFAYSKNIGCILPYRDHEDRAIMLYRLGSYHKEGLTIEDSLCLLLGMGFCLTRDPATQVGGVALLVDAKDVIYSDASTILSYVRWMIPLLRGFPGRFRRVDIVNQPYIFGKLVTLIRPLLPSKIRARFMVHGNNQDSLLQVYPSSIIPNEYGGTLGPLNNDHWMDQLETCYNYFETDVRKCCEHDLAN